MTEFGKKLRIIRMDKQELLYDMANKLEVTSSFLSGIEHGKRKPPLNMGLDIAKLYNFNEEETNELDQMCIKQIRDMKEV
jgi:transcriptional regulator with XRE-family HTH domain